MNAPAPPPRHIVVIAERDDLRQVLAAVIDDMGHRATTWPSCPDASRLREADANAVVIDLPFENQGAAGLALMRAIRGGDGTRDLPVVASIDAIDGGVNADTLLAFTRVTVVTKPFGVEEFERALQRALDEFTANR